MDISDPIVANCLIDQREVECILLIPTSKEASEIMSDARRVPRNCKRAFTQQGDIFYPDPHYRSYGGPRGLKAKFLQVSVKDTINALEEELRAIDNEKSVAMKAYTTACEKEKRVSSELTSVNTKVAKLHAAQSQYKGSINDLKDNLEANEVISVTVFKNELIELENKIRQEKQEESRLNECVHELQKKIETLDAEIKRHRELRLNVDLKINPLRDSIKKLREEKDAVRAKSRYAAKKLQALRQALQNATAEFEMQQRATEKAVSDGTSRCERIETQRSIGELERLYRDLNGKIREIERQFGSIEQLREKLKEKESKCGKDFHLASKIEKSYKEHLKRLAARRQLFIDMKHKYGINIQNSFSNILSLRGRVVRRNNFAFKYEKAVVYYVIFVLSGRHKYRPFAKGT